MSEEFATLALVLDTSPFESALDNVENRITNFSENAANAGLTPKNPNNEAASPAILRESLLNALNSSEINQKLSDYWPETNNGISNIINAISEKEVVKIEAIFAV